MWHSHRQVRDAHAIRGALAFLVALILGCVGPVGGVQAGPGELHQGFDLSVLHPPSLLDIDGEHRLVHELHLTNFSSRPIRITRVRVVGERRRAPLVDLAGGELADALVHLGAAPDGKLVVPAGARVSVHFDAPVHSPLESAGVRHLVDYVIDGRSGDMQGLVEGGNATVATELPVLSPPLKGGPWVAVYLAGHERGHRRVIYAVGGRAKIPGRFAIDWMKPGPSVEGGGGLGAEVLAVADGVVASTRDGVHAPAPGTPRTPGGLADAAGNHVSIDIGGGRYAFYEHLMPGLEVEPGQRVRRGDVIGRLGSTGQASRPHLHFHVADRNSTLDAEGLPYLLEGARRIGRYGSLESFQSGDAWSPVDHHQTEGDASFPASNAVVIFGN